jgi:hypothetical protein
VFAKKQAKEQADANPASPSEQTVDAAFTEVDPEEKK